jgi:predicted MFS family arabinose efflux permease
VGAERVLAVDAASYLAFVACLTAVPRGRPAVADDEPGARTPARLRPAFAFLVRTPPVRATTLMYMAINAGETMLIVLLPAYTHTVLGGGPRTYGLLVSVFAVGTLAGTVVVGAVRWPWPLGRSISAAAALSGGALAFLMLRPGVTGTAAALLAAGVLASPLTVWAQTIRMRVIPPELRGRVFGMIRTLIQSTPPIGAAVAGAIVAGPGVGAVAAVMSAVVSASGVAGLWSRALRPDPTVDRAPAAAPAAIGP